MSDCKHEKFGGDHHCCECGGYGPELATALATDAARYRFMRDIRCWGDVGGSTSWDRLSESYGDEFEAIVDSRMSDSRNTDNG